MVRLIHKASGVAVVVDEATAATLGKAYVPAEQANESKADEAKSARNRRAVAKD